MEQQLQQAQADRTSALQDAEVSRSPCPFHSQFTVTWTPCSCAPPLGLCTEHAVLTCRAAAEVGVEHLRFLTRAELVAAESSRLQHLYAGKGTGRRLLAGAAQIQDPQHPAGPAEPGPQLPQQAGAQVPSHQAGPPFPQQAGPQVHPPLHADPQFALYTNQQ